TELPPRTAHPPWIVERIAAAWPQACPAILAANNGHPPMTLRLDLSRTDRTAYLIELSRASIDAHEVPWAPAAVTLAHPVAVSRLPGFGEGKVSVQDAGAQLAAPLLDARPGMRVLDACAAPGGKTAHVLENAGEKVEVVAVDIDAGRAAEPRLALARMPAGGELAPGAVDRRAGAQLLPGAEAGTDGFYYACLEKTTAGI